MSLLLRSVLLTAPLKVSCVDFRVEYISLKDVSSIKTSFFDVNSVEISLVDVRSVDIILVGISFILYPDFGAKMN